MTPSQTSYYLLEKQNPLASTQLNPLLLQTTANTISERESGKPLPMQRNDWIAGIGLFVLILIAIIRFSFITYLHRLFRSVFNYQTAKSLFLEKNMRYIWGSILIGSLFFLNFSLFCTLCQKNFKFTPNLEVSFLSYISLVVVLLLIYAGKFILIKGLGYIFNRIEISKEYLHTVFIYNSNLGILLLPFTLSVPFIIGTCTRVVLLNLALFLVIILYVFRLVRGMKILFLKHVSILYSILYLCALEILPLIIVLKMLKLQI